MTTCQTQQPTEADSTAGQTPQNQTDQGATEEEDSDFFQWLNDAFSTSAGGQTAKPSQSTHPNNDRDHGKDHGGKGGGGGGGGGGSGGH